MKMKFKVMAIALIALLLAGCTTDTPDPPSTSAATTSGTYVTQSVAQTTATEQTPITNEPVVTTADLVVTTAPNEVPNTSEEPTITDAQQTVKPETTPAQTTTIAPMTSEMPATTTEAPATTTTAPTTTTKAPATTTAVPVTTTKAPTTTTKAPSTTTKIPVVTEAPHTHSYSAWKTTKEATCTADGTQIRTCSCGASETKTIDATGHSYSSWKTTKTATCSAEGTKTKTCTNCGDKKTETIAKTDHSYGAWTLCSDYINEEATCKTCGTKTTQRHYADPETDERLVADRVIYYINQYREAEGSTVATKLDRFTLVAEMRSSQLVGLTASDPSSEWHNSDDVLECGTYYEYGKKMANGTYDPETDEITYDGTYSYRIPGNEAVGYNGWSEGATTIDNIAYQIATQVHNSSGHWRYVGSSDYSYIAVGVTEAYDRSYFAIFVCDTNEYE